MLDLTEFFNNGSGWIIALEVIYVLILAATILRIIYDTDDVSKTLGYLLVVIFIPVAGIIIYFVIGVNYRKRKIYSNKYSQNAELLKEVGLWSEERKKEVYDEYLSTLQPYCKLVLLLASDAYSPLSVYNNVEVLRNGEVKFPKVFEAIRSAKHHIHLEYYIYADNRIGQELTELLIEKAKEGVTIRVLYDDYGSRTIRKTLVPRMKEVGIDAIPFYEIYFIALANRINYRNHRKIIVIDGEVGFMGGINISEPYINRPEDDEDKIFWRDTAIMVRGELVHSLQATFFADWNFCKEEKIELSDEYFPSFQDEDLGVHLMQLVTGGPDSVTSTISNCMIQAINIAQEEILITTPYFIPNDSLMSALIIAAQSHIKITLLVPDISDSWLVKLASESYYMSLMEVGVKVYRYQKGFIHSKTMVIDQRISIVGSANLDVRSFDLNFEVNTIMYNEELAKVMVEEFEKDLEVSEQIDPEEWKDRSWVRILVHRIARLFSPLL